MRFLNLLDLAFLALKKIVLPPQNIPGDDFEIYTTGVDVNGLDVGWCGNHIYDICWAGPYVARTWNFSLTIFDSFESYTDGEGLSGLNDGIGFSSAYVTHDY